MNSYLEEINEILEKHGVDGLDTVIMELDTVTDCWYHRLHKYMQWDQEVTRKEFDNEVLHFKEVFDKHYGCLRDIASKLDIDMFDADISPDLFKENG